MSTLQVAGPVNVWRAEHTTGPWWLCPQLRATRCTWSHGMRLGTASIVGVSGRVARGEQSMEVRDALNGMVAGCIVRVGPVGGPYWYGTVRRIRRLWRGVDAQDLQIEAEGLGSLADQRAIAQGWDDTGANMGWCPPFRQDNRSAAKVAPAGYSGTAYVHTGEGAGTSWTVRDVAEHLAQLQYGIIRAEGLTDWDVAVAADVSAAPTTPIGLYDPAGRSVAHGLAEVLSIRRGLTVTYGVSADGLPSITAHDLTAAGSPLDLVGEQIAGLETSSSDDDADVVLVAGEMQETEAVYLEWHGPDATTGELRSTIVDGVLSLAPMDEWDPSVAGAVHDNLSWTGAASARSSDRVNVAWLRLAPTGTVRLGTSTTLDDRVTLVPLDDALGAPGLEVRLGNGSTWAALARFASPTRPLRIQARLLCLWPAVAGAEAAPSTWPRVVPRVRAVSLAQGDRAACAAVATRELQATQEGARWSWPGQLTDTLMPASVISALTLDGAPVHPGPLIVDSVTWILEPLQSRSTIIDCHPVYLAEVRP